MPSLKLPQKTISDSSAFKYDEIYLIFAPPSDIPTKIPLLLIEADIEIIEFLCRTVNDEINGMLNLQTFHGFFIPTLRLVLQG